MPPAGRRGRARPSSVAAAARPSARPRRPPSKGCCRDYGIDLDAGLPADLRGLFEADVCAVRLEIGFGGGEHLLAEADRLPATGFIGVEPFVNGMAKLMAALEKRPRRNLRVYGDDATKLLDRMPEASLDGIDLLYPDPWPKKRHWKRRFVGRVNLDRFARIMKPGAQFRFASDIGSYIDWTLAACRAHPEFAWTATCAADWREPYPFWPGTRYEAKAISQGRTPAYLTFVRR